jgi:hypothetical protein
MQVPALDRPSGRRVLDDLREGWSEFWSRRWLWIMVGQGSAGVLCWLVGFQLLGPVYAAEQLGGAAAWGLIASGFAAGLAGGSVVAMLWRPRLIGPVVCAGIGSMALPLAAMAGGAPWPWVAVAAAVTGVGLDVSIVSWSTLLQQQVAADRLSRVSSVNALGQILFAPVGYAAAGPVSEAVGVASTLAACAALITLAALVPLAAPEVRWLAASPQTLTGRGDEAVPTHQPARSWLAGRRGDSAVVPGSP